MKISMHKKETSLVPVGVSDFDKFNKLKDLDYSVKITKIRSPKHHRFFFAMLRAVIENMPEELEAVYPSQETLLNELKLQTGYRTRHQTLGGKITYFPKSISFENMDELEFIEFHKKCEVIILKYFLVGVSKKDLHNFIGEYM